LARLTLRSYPHSRIFTDLIFDFAFQRMFGNSCRFTVTLVLPSFSFDLETCGSIPWHCRLGRGIQRPFSSRLPTSMMEAFIPWRNSITPFTHRRERPNGVGIRRGDDPPVGDLRSISEWVHGSFLPCDVMNFGNSIMSDKTKGLVDPLTPVARCKLAGPLPNRDTWLPV
jgi:hypothetical protein